MITISQNLNFKEWIDIKVRGVLVDNVKSYASALSVAHKVQASHKAKRGETLAIVHRKA